MSTGETTNEHIGVLLGIYSDPLVRVEETETEWWLGTFSLDKYHASFRVGFGGPLSAQSRFRKQWFNVPENGLKGWAVISRQFDRCATSEVPEEFFVGWVPPERETDVELWLAFLNNEVAERLRGEPARGT